MEEMELNPRSLQIRIEELECELKFALEAVEYNTLLKNELEWRASKQAETIDALQLTIKNLCKSMCSSTNCNYDAEKDIHIHIQR